MGTSVTYTVNATVIASPSGTLDSTATIYPPSGITDPFPYNDAATDSDQLIIPSLFPYGNIDPTPNGSIEYIPTDRMVTLQFGNPLVVGGNAGYDLVYYELPEGTKPGIWMDCVILQLGTGGKWYTIFNWGDKNTDTNASMNMDTIGVGAEVDNLPVDADFMYNATGIALELDGVVPDGTYKYIRIISPDTPIDKGDGVEVDAIQVLP